MLLDLSVDDFGMFRDGFRIDMRKSCGDELPGNLLESRNAKNGVLCSAVVFGQNCTGKSTIVKALETVRRIALGSAPVKNTFMNGDGPSRISLTFTDEADVLFEYSVSFTDIITEEAASFSPNGRRTKVFSRKGDTVEPGSKFGGLNGLDADSRTSFLHTAEEWGDEVCGRMHDWFSHCMFTVPEFTRERAIGMIGIINRNPELKADLVSTLRSAGFRIAGMDQDGITYEYPEEGENRCTIPYTEESMGTMEAIMVFYSMYYALKSGALLVSDCIGSHMHSDRTRFVLQQFSRDSNPSKAQMIAVSHDLSLMSTDVLRRDQMIIASADGRTGAASARAVSEFKGVRAGSDIVRAFENGKFDNLPEDSGTLSLEPE